VAIAKTLSHRERVAAPPPGEGLQRSASLPAAALFFEALTGKSIPPASLQNPGQYGVEIREHLIIIQSQEPSGNVNKSALVTADVYKRQK
jgi:hypothetical protein